MRDERDHIEREIKLALKSEAAYLLLLELLPRPHQKLTQTNLFFDTLARELSQLHWALRLRREKSANNIERNTIALKGPSSVRDGVTSRQEHEHDISIEAAKTIHDARVMHRNDLGILAELIAYTKADAFAQIASFENVRTISSVVINEMPLLFEVDATIYSDGTIDYELEIELSADQSSMKLLTDSISELLTNWNIQFMQQTKSKFERALEHAGIAR